MFVKRVWIYMDDPHKCLQPASFVTANLLLLYDQNVGQQPYF